MYVQRYFSALIAQLEQVAHQSEASIHAAATAVADALANDKDYLLFGSGHSALIAQDGFWRAGGLAPAILISDFANGAAERLEGIAALILSHYTLRAGSVIVVVSNSGINATPIEVALLSQAAGLTVVAITAMAHSQAVESRHSNGKKLYEIADIVIDLHGVPGDAAIELPNSHLRSGATSTAVGAAIIQAIGTQAAAILAERGIEPPVLISANVPEGDIHNEKLRARYRPTMSRHLISQPVPVNKHPK